MTTTRNTTTALEAYETRTAAIKKVLAQIETGLEMHDKDQSLKHGHTWGSVGDLDDIYETLRDLRDRLHETGQYAPAIKTYKAYNSKGQSVRVTVPEA
jgi:hypothetical protein